MHSSSATLKELQNRLREIKKEIEKVKYRITETSEFPKAVESCRSNLNITRILIQNITDILEVTEEEYNQTIHDLEDLEKWITEKEAEQSQVQPFQDPKVSSSSINSRCSVFSTLTKRLFGRKKRVLPKATTPNNSTTSGNQTVSNNQTAENEDSNQNPQKEEEII